VIPFYHGANRYLDATYVTGERTPKRYSLMVDFLFLFAQGLLLFTLALTISAGEVETVDKYFFWGLGLLLISDVIWILTTTITTIHQTDEKKGSAFKYFPWLALNVFATALIFTLVHYEWWLGLLLLTFVRSALDYLIAHDSYYPKTPTAARGFKPCQESQ
jgi:hypothetical protein